MDRAKEMVRGVFPDSVRFAALGEVGEFIRGGGLQKTDLIDQGAPAIHYGQIHTLYGTSAAVTKSFVDPALAAKLRRAMRGDLLIATTSEDNASVGKATAWLGEGEVATSGDAYIYRHRLDPSYVAYFFQSEQFRAQKARHITGTKVRRISGKALSTIRIPVPHIGVQREIVRILDKYAELESDLAGQLEAEIGLRASQFVFHRDLLLHFPKETVATLPMAEAGTFFGGLTGKSKADFENGNARYISYLNIYNNISVDLLRDNFVRVEPHERQRTLARGDVLFTGSSETAIDAGMSAVVTQEVLEPTYLNSFSIGFRPSLDLFDPEFAKHIFRSGPMRRQIAQTASGVTRFNVSKSRLARVEVPVPSMQEQSRIALILDSLASSTEVLQATLVAERAARQKQYAHYREKLLTFDEVVA